MRLIPKLWRLPIGVFLSLNSNLGRNLPFALVTTSAIAAAVAMATSLEITSRALQADMNASADALAGDAEIEIVGGELGVPERLLAQVSRIEGVASASPLLSSTFRLVRDGTPLLVLGMDLASERNARDYSVERDGVRVRDVLRLLVRPESVIVAPALAERIGAKLGSVVPVGTGARKLDLVVEGTLGEGGIADAFGGQIAVMDVYSLQSLLGREGWLQRIDIDVADGVEPDAVLAALEARVGDSATVRPSSLRESFIGTTLEMIRMAVLVIAGVGGVVACMLSYAAISLSVVRRAHELSILSSVGLEQTSLRRLVFFDCVSYSLVGTALGLGVGTLLPEFFVGWTGALSEVNAQVDRRLLVVASSTYWIAGVVGLGAAMVGLVASLPEVGVPFDTRGRSGAESNPIARRKLWMLAGAGVGVAVMLAPGVPDLLRAGLFALVAIGLLMFSGPYLVRGLERARPMLERLVPRIGQLVGTGLSARPRSAALTASCLGGVAAAVTTIFTFTASFDRSLGDLAAALYPGAIRISATAPFTTGHWERISEASLEAIRSSHQVAGVMDMYFTSGIFQGREISLRAMEMRSLEKHDLGRGVFAECLNAGFGPRNVGATFSFLRAFGVKVGDRIALKTPAGRQQFEIACSYPGFAGPSGALMMDLATFDEHWTRLPPRFIVAWPKGELSELMSDLRTRTARIQPLFFTDAATIRKHVSSYVARYSSALNTLALLALALGGIAMANSLIGVVAERKRELDLLRAAGASPRHLAGLVLADGAALAIIGSVFGICLGLIVSYPVTAAVGDAFGWSLEVSINLKAILGLLAAMSATVLLACAFPMRAARRAIPGDMFEPG